MDVTLKWYAFSFSAVFLMAFSYSNFVGIRDEHEYESFQKHWGIINRTVFFLIMCDKEVTICFLKGSNVV